MSRTAAAAACLALAFAGIGWGAVQLLPAARVQLADGVVRQALNGGTLPPAIIERTTASLDRATAGRCLEQPLWNLLILDLVTFQARQSSLAEADVMRGAMAARARRLLACSPRRAGAWFLLAWLDIHEQGPQPEALERIAISYRLAPHEAWLARLRNPVAARLFGLFEEAVRAQIVSEFRELVRLGFLTEAQAVLEQTGERTRATLLAGLSTLDIDARQVFSRSLDRAGLDMDVPGISREMQRLWR